MGTKSAWPPERRARQAVNIRATQPWTKSTGPKTPEGKAVSSRNAYKGDWYHDGLARLSDAKAGALAVFGRQRYPKGFGRNK